MKKRMVRNRKTKFTKDRTVRKWFYLFTLVSVFFAFFSFVFVQFQTAVFQTLMQTNKDFVIQIDTANEALMENIKTSAMQMFYTSSIKNLRTKNQLTNSEIIIGSRDLGNFVSSSDFLESVIIYNDKQDIFFTSEEEYSAVKGEDFHDQEAVRILSNTEEFPYCSPIRQSKNSTIYYSFLFYEKSQEHTSALLLTVKGEWFESHLMGIPSPGSHIIIDKDGQLIVYYDPQISKQFHEIWPALKSSIEAEPEGGVVRLSGFSSDSAWIYQYLGEPGLYYLKYLSISEVAPGIVYMRNFLFVTFLTVGGILLITLGHLLTKVYLPFSHVRNVLSSSGFENKNIPEQIDELLVQQKKSSTAKKIKSMRAGIIPDDFPLPLLIIMAAEEEQGRLFSIVKEICEHIITVQEGGNYIAVIPNANLEMREKIVERLSEYVNMQIYLSDIIKKSNQLPDAFSALEELEKLRFLYSHRQVMGFDILRDCNEISRLQNKEVYTLINILKAGELEQANKQWGKIFALIRKDRYADFCFSVKYIVKKLSALCDEYGIKCQHLLNVDIDEMENVEVLHTFMAEQFVLITDASTQIRLDQLTNQAYEIDLYIREKYAETELSAQLIAEHFEVSTAYLNRQYRQVTDISISDAINVYRIERACLLLKETKKPIELIAQEIGYINTKYFFVLFKKIKQKTPKQYRESTNC